MKNIWLISIAALILSIGCSKNDSGDNPEPAPGPGPAPTVSVWDGKTVTEPDDLNRTAKTATIRRASDLAWLSQQSNASPENTFEGWVFTLAINIDLGDKAWTPIAIWLPSHPVIFKGTFDGAGHSIEGLNVKIIDTYNDYGLFGVTQGACIRNLHVSGKVDGVMFIGGICANIQEGSLIEGCTFSGRVLEGKMGSLTGGISGRVYNSEIRNCHSDATLVYGNSLYRYTGGIAGKTSESVIRNCSFSGTLEKGAADLSGQPSAFGGIVGWMVDSEVFACKNSANLRAASPVTIRLGGIVGQMETNKAAGNSVVMSSYNTGAITNSANEGNTGGIAGYTTGKSVIGACYNTGVVTGSANESEAANQEMCCWPADFSAIIDCYYAADKHEYRGARRFSASAWPQESTESAWNIGNDPATFKFWKSLGTPGTTAYPILWWE